MQLVPIALKTCMALVKSVHTLEATYFSPMLMKFGQKISANDSLDELDNGSGWWKNMAARGLPFLL